MNSMDFGSSWALWRGILRHTLWMGTRKKMLYESGKMEIFWKKPHWNIFKNIHGWHLKNCHGLDGANQVVRCFPVSAFRDLSSLKLDHNCLPHSMLQKMEKKGRFSLVFVLFREKTACCWVPCACYDVNVLCILVVCFDGFCLLLNEECCFCHFCCKTGFC